MRNWKRFVITGGKAGSVPITRYIDVRLALLLDISFIIDEIEQAFLVSFASMDNLHHEKIFD